VRDALDILLSQNNTTEVLYNDGSGNFTSPVEILPDRLEAVLDINGDGVEEFLCSGEIFSLTGAATFEKLDLCYSGAVLCGDLDLDGSADLFRGNEFFANAGDGHFTLVDQISRAADLLLDVDGDGDLDALICSSDSPGLYLNQIPEPISLFLILLGSLAVRPRRRGK